MTERDAPGVTENSPEGPGPATLRDRVEPGAVPPPDTNQGKTEPMPSATQPAVQTGNVGSGNPGAHNTPVPGDAKRQPQEGGTPPPGALADDDQLGAARTRPGLPPESIAPPVPSPGDVHHTNSAPSVEAAQGTSEASGKVTGIRATAIAPPGKPDGEVDTRL